MTTDYQTLINYLENNHSQSLDGVIVLTATRRLARHAIRACASRGLSLRILSYKDWLQTLWENSMQQACAAPLLLSDWQSEAIWQQLILQQSYHEQLINLRDLAKQAQSAWNMLRQWQCQLDALKAYPLSTDHQLFIELASEYQAYCQARGWIDAFDLEASLQSRLSLFSQNEILEEIIVYGFDEFVPSMQCFLAHLKTHWQDVQQCCLNESLTANVRVQAFPDKATEWQAAAQYAQHAVLTQPEASIGIVIPTLAEDRAQIQQIFNDTLAPHCRYELHAQELPYTLSSGQPLDEVLVIQCLFDWLRWIITPLSLDKILACLTSPYWCAASSTKAAVYRADQLLREAGVEQMDYAQYWDVLKRAVTLKQLEANVLQDLEAVFCFRHEEMTSTNRHASEWATLWSECFYRLGWPGEHSVNSAEFQAIQQFHEVLDQFVGLDYVLSKLPWHHALHILQNKTHERLYQIKSEDKSIQILGVLEAAGLVFDQLWLCGLTDSVWPAPAQPNPLLPIALQRELQMPHASSERELYFSQLMTQRFLASAHQVIFTYPLQEDELPAKISPLIAPYMTCENGLKRQSEALKGQDEPLVDNWIHFQDDQGLPFHKTDAPGGSRLFTDLSACAFKAYATHRLRINRFNLPWQGLNALEKGLLLHHALELFWRKIRHHQKLIALTEEQLASTIEEISLKVIEHFKAHALQLPSEMVLSLEMERIQQCLHDWLQQERARDDFAVVGIEYGIMSDIEQLNFKFRLDRMDRLANGEYLLIDYKTSAKSLSVWQGERPDEPQLPLYASLFNQNVAGIAFGEIVRKQSKLKGIARQGLDVTGLKSIEDWASQLLTWQSTAQQFVRQFKAGEAARNPKRGWQTCARCDYQGLCRILDKEQG